MTDPFAQHVATPGAGDPPAMPGPEAEAREGRADRGVPSRFEAAPAPAVGRIVHYVLTESDIARIPWGGGNAEPGQVVPAIVVCDVGNGALSLHAFPEAQTSVWVYARGEGSEPGQWSWPPRIDAGSA